MTGPQPYDEKIRLAQIIGDARELLADQDRGYSPDTGYARRCGALEVLLKLVCDSAEAFTPYATEAEIRRASADFETGGAR